VGQLYQGAAGAWYEAWVLVLASASPRRADLLRGAGVTITIAAVDADETWRAGEAPPAYAARVARAKAALALPRHHGSVVLAADTTVWLAGGPPLGKPGDRAEAAAMLATLTRRGEHHVTTAFAVVDARGREQIWLEDQVTTRVWMRSLADDELAAYLDSEDWRGKAGGYGIQSRAAGLVTRIEGSYTAVVGLPLAEVLVALRGLGV
jgi:septum formation protein